VTITSCVLSYPIWKFLRLAMPFRLKTDITILENNCMQSMASSAGYSTGGTMVLANKVLRLLAIIMFSFFAQSHAEMPASSKVKMKTGVFVLGGIHQAHEKAKIYTYQRMGQIYEKLKPDVLCVETLPKFSADNSFTGTPYDFKKYVIPAAQKDGIPISGIDWWDNEKGKKWEELQDQASNDATLQKEIDLLGGMFKLLNDYFIRSDFREINSEHVTRMWAAKDRFRNDVFEKHSKYAFLKEYERMRNENIAKNILDTVKKYPDKSVLVAVGIAHKYYIEQALREHEIKVLSVDELPD